MSVSMAKLKYIVMTLLILGLGVAGAFFVPGLTWYILIPYIIILIFIASMPLAFGYHFLMYYKTERVFGIELNPQQRFFAFFILNIVFYFVVTAPFYAVKYLFTKS